MGHGGKTVAATYENWEILMQFNCVSCGECCRHIHLVEGLKHLQTNGVCKHLVNDLCVIYNNRPDLCRYDALYDMLKEQFSITAYNDLSAQYCLQLQDLKQKRLNDEQTSLIGTASGMFPCAYPKDQI